MTHLRKRRPSGVAQAVPAVLVGPPGLAKEGLRQVLQAAPFRVLGSVPSLHDVTPAVAAKVALIIVTDAAQPDLASAVRGLRDDRPALRIAALIDTSSPTAIAEALRVPAHAFICRRTGCDALVAALGAVLADCSVLPTEALAYLQSGRGDPERASAPGVEGAAARHASDKATSAVEQPVPQLSEREIKVLRCLTGGESNKAIAFRFCMTEPNVKVHVKSILRKISAQNRTQAAVWALANLPPHAPPQAASAQNA